MDFPMITDRWLALSHEGSLETNCYFYHNSCATHLCWNNFLLGFASNLAKTSGLLLCKGLVRVTSSAPFALGKMRCINTGALITEQLRGRIPLLSQHQMLIDSLNFPCLFYHLPYTAHYWFWKLEALSWKYRCTLYHHVDGISIRIPLKSHP